MNQPDARAIECTDTHPQPVSFRQAFAFWFKLGFISFGGPAGQISLMHQELVVNRRWISERRFLHALNYCMLLPGPEARQLATYIGWLMHRTWGGIVAGTLFVLPSLLILIALSWVYIAFGNLPLVAGLFYGVKPAVTAIVAQAAYRIGSRALKNNALWGIAAASFVAIFALNVPFPAIVAAAAIIGYLGGRIAPGKFKAGGGHGKTDKSFGPALIDDDTPTPEHARFRWIKLVKMAVVGGLLWAVPMGLLNAIYGWHHTLTQMGWFFTKAALLTFGGAYAVLPYVYQGAVGHYGWLTPTQMIDGLALGERTAHHGGGLRRLRRRLRESAVRARLPVFSRSSGGHAGNMVHLSALVPVHSGGWPFGRIHARRPQIHGTIDGYHRRRGGRDSQSGVVFSLSRTVAAGICRNLRLDLGRHRAGSSRRFVPLQAECHRGDRRLRDDRFDPENLNVR